MTTRTRRPQQLKWQPPTPRVHNLPCRHVRTSANNKQRGSTTRRLEALFDEERVFGKEDYGLPVVVLNAGAGDSEVAGVESEMLRAECRFLRMERELALKKVKRNRARMERLLRSALQTLISGRDKLGAECKCGTGTRSSVCESLDDEIEAMRFMLMDLQTLSASTTRTKVFEAALDDPPHHILIPGEIQELAGASFTASSTELSISIGSSSRFTDVEHLSWIMTDADDGLMNHSKVGSGSSASTSGQIQMPNLASIRQGYQEEKEGVGRDEEEQPCSGRCRAVVRRVAEQVRFETEQWSQVQDMLEKVKEEMEHLQASRDKWEQLALVSQDQIISLNSTVEAWKKRALSEEAKLNDLQTQVQVLQEELKMVREAARTNSLSLTSTKNLNPTEKQASPCQRKENHDLKNGNSRRPREEKKKLEVLKRSPFLDIGNSSPLMRQITKVVFPGHRR